MAGESSLTRTFGDILTTTADGVRPIMADIITSRVTTLYVLDKVGQVKQAWDGGATIQFNVFKELTGAFAYSDMDALDITRGTPFSRVICNWKQFGAQIVVSGLQMAQNSGEFQIVNLIDGYFDAAEGSLAEQIGGSTRGIFSTGTESTPLQLTGLQSWVSTTTNAGTIGNLSRANSFWQNQSLSCSGAFGTNGLNQMRSLALRLTRGADRPNLVVFNRSTFENFHRVHQATLSYNLPYGSSPAPAQASTAVLDLGVPTIRWQNMDVIYDDFCPANLGYMLTYKYLHFVVHKERDFALGEFVKPADVDGLIAHIFWMGELACSSLRNQGNLTATDTY